MDIPLMAICHWPQSMTKAYGQSSKKCHWQWSMTKKLSLTMVNDKKNCHWLKVIYIGVFHKCFELLLTLFIHFATARLGQIYQRWTDSIADYESWSYQDRLRHDQSRLNGEICCEPNLNQSLSLFPRSLDLNAWVIQAA